MRWTVFLAVVTFGLAAAAEPVPVRGVTWQWCFRNPGVDFCLRSVDVMAELGYNAILPEFGACLESRHYQADRDEFFSRDNYRKVLRHCKARGLEVIPILNALGHSERSIPWVKTLDYVGMLSHKPGKGMDLGEEANYTLLFDVLDEHLAELKACGLPTRYLHLGCDEAGDMLLANEKQYGKTPQELLQRHLLRLREYCHSRSVKMIIWHDMLMGSKDPLFDQDMQYVFADRVETRKCRPNIPRDIILMYWNYEPKEHYGVVSGLVKEGFEVWLAPWGVGSVRKLAEQAHHEHLQGVVVSTWMESGGREPPGENHLYTQPWMLESLLRGGDCLSDAAKCNAPLTVDPILTCIAKFFPKGEAEFCPPPRQSAHCAMMDKAPYLARHAPSSVLLGKWPTGRTNFSELTKPYRALCNTTNIAITGCNVTRGQDELILYTQEFGASTQCNGYGTEVSADAKGVVQTKTTWGVGDSRIPPAGFVLSGHSKGAGPLVMNPGDRIEIFGANGVRLQSSELDSGCKELSLCENGKRLETVSFLWGAGRSLPLDGHTIGTVSLAYADGTKATVDLAFGRDIACWETPLFFWGERPDVRVWLAFPESSGRNTGKALTGWSWRNPHPEKPVQECRLELLPVGYEMGLLLAGVE